MIKNFVNWFFSPSNRLIDEDHVDFYSKLIELEQRIKILEEENVETTNSLYEVENRLQAQIDNIHPVTYNLKTTNWDQ